ncbi:MAG TPA: GIY-YIG nuclease family protein [Ureibacillus sp.]|nr:GIY-YIG nuclease family protein [Ureibacillus sp.]
MSKVITTEYFIKKAKSIHGDKYNYDKVIYVMSNKKVIIHCYKHGDFEQTPGNHCHKRNPQGCPQCGIDRKSDFFSFNTDEFIKKSKEKHGDRYDYSLVDYKNSREKVKIICGEHGVFEQRAVNHLGGFGCVKCANDKVSSIKSYDTKDFIEKAIKTHGYKYDYTLVKYVNSQNKVKIICPIHGVFEQKANNHLNNRGCYKCSRDVVSRRHKEKPQGWNITSWQKKAEQAKNFDSFKVYIIKCWNENEEFYKIGRTYNTIKRRFTGKYNMPYNYEVLKEIIFHNAKDCFDKENELKLLHKNFKKIPSIKFNGMNECFSEINFDILN